MILEEPLVEGALLACDAAPRWCRTEPGGGENCAWYHGLWPSLRALGIGTSPAVHAPMMLSALGALARERRHSRVLISGCADYSLFAHVVWAYGREDAALECTVVDLCETPLYLCRWYAQRVSAKVQTRAIDIIDFDSEAQFEVICAHAFLGYFDEGGRRRLMARWRALLRPGGRLILVQRLRPDYPDAVVRFTPEQAHVFTQRVGHEARARQAELGIDPDTLVQAARTYAERHWHYPIRSRRELHGLFTEAGFVFDRFDVGPVEPASANELTGPTVPGNADFAHIVAH